MGKLMNSLLKKRGLLLLLISLVFILSISSVSAIEISVVNSENWADVYSVMLYSSLQDKTAVFTNSESVSSLTQFLSKDNDLIVYESTKTPFIKNLDSQLESVEFQVKDTEKSSDFNIDLDPETGKYFVISEDNSRISISLAPLAVRDDYWVLIVNEDNLGSVSRKLANADSVIAVGNFKRSYLDELESHFSEWINNKDLFADSQALATRLGINDDLVVLADGLFLEKEFFITETPVLLTGHNKILGDTYDFLESEGVKYVVIVGNELAVVGEQIREKSNQEISVRVKFGQSGSDITTGTVYGLSMFALPQQTIGLTVQKAAYNPLNKELIIYYENLGNSGIYSLTTLSVKEEGIELASKSDSETLFLGARELLPVIYDVELPVEDLTEETRVEFYTSFGLYPSQLDTFLTMENKYGPPFSIPLVVEEIGDDGTLLDILDVTYYKALKRVGVKVFNNASTKAYYNIKIKELIVNGLEEDLFKEDEILPGKTQTTYLPVELDKVDLEENRNFKVTLAYGANEDVLLKSLKDKEYEFKSVAGLNTTTIIIIVVIVLIIAALIFFLKKKR